MKKASVGEFSTERSFVGMSSHTNKIIPAPLTFRSTLQSAPKSSIVNWSIGKLSSSFVTETIKISTLPVIWPVRLSNLFLKEFMLRWGTTVSLMLCWRSILNFSLELKLALYSSIKQLSSLCKIDCQYTAQKTVTFFDVPGNFVLFVVLLTIFTIKLHMEKLPER